MHLLFLLSFVYKRNMLAPSLFLDVLCPGIDAFSDWGLPPLCHCGHVFFISVYRYESISVGPKSTPAWPRLPNWARLSTRAVCCSVDDEFVSETRLPVASHQPASHISLHASIIFRTQSSRYNSAPPQPRRSTSVHPPSQKEITQRRVIVEACQPPLHCFFFRSKTWKSVSLPIRT